MKTKLNVPGIQKFFHSKQFKNKPTNLTEGKKILRKTFLNSYFPEHMWTVVSNITQESHSDGFLYYRSSHLKIRTPLTEKRIMKSFKKFFKNIDKKSKELKSLFYVFII